MSAELTEHGFLRIKNEADRVTVASILYKNDYSVSPIKKAKNGRTYDYFIEFSVAQTVSQKTEGTV